ncbi:MAG TPA: carboxymuconolactone decarboxylase family protein [Terriglobales bacterium]|nr:carboxymuconolactone decarboxylase family protein [Terriglobales bacterium]
MTEREAQSEVRIPLVERDMLSDAPPELATLYDALLAQRGVVPNMFKTLAHVPNIAIGFAALLKPLLSDGALPGWYKELVATRLSVLLKSSYAVTAHSLSAKQKGATEQQIAAARGDFESGPFTDQQKLGFRCAERLHRSAAEINDTFYTELKSLFDDRQIIELIATASAFELFPRFVDALRIPTTPAPQIQRQT